MFKAAFETAYCVFRLWLISRMKSGSPAPEVITTILFVCPARRSGRKALMECTTPSVLVRNCFGDNSWRRLVRTLRSRHTHGIDVILFQLFRIRTAVYEVGV